MKRSDFTTPAANLREAWQNLEAAWQEAKEHWSDSVTRNFEENYMSHVRPSVESTMNAVGRLSSALDVATRECSDGGERTYL